MLQFRNFARRWVATAAALATLAAPLVAARRQAADDPRSEGTKEMAALLEHLAQTNEPMENWFLNGPRAAILVKKAEKATGTRREDDLRLRAATELIQSNQCEAALAQLDALDAAIAAKTTGDEETPRESTRLRALAWFRTGEIENCLGRHTCESCVVPIKAGAVHVKKRGSEAAIPLLNQLLADDPTDLESLWLLNLAHMTLGTYPEGVPTKFLIPPSAFESDYPLPRFPDVADECGLGVVNTSGSELLEDFDGDGLLDVMLCSIGLRDPMHFFHSNGDGTFTERTHQAGLDGEVGGLNLIDGDYDNDGDVDVLVLRGAWAGEQGLLPNSLLRNRGDGTFEDVTKAAGMLSFHPTQAGVFADFNNDGFLDVIIGNESQPRQPDHPCELYVNQRDGTFKNLAKEIGCDLTQFVKAVAVGDYDNDGRVDVYMSCRSKDNHLFHNEPNPNAAGFILRDATIGSGTTMPHMSFPTFFFDYDNDGLLDLFVATNNGFGGHRTEDIAHLYLHQPINCEQPKLYHNMGRGRFVDVAKQTGIDQALFSMGANFGDLDNDGWLDVYLGTGSPDFRALLPNKMFRNDGGERFQDVTSAGGFGNLQKGHGIAFADLDNDGDQDVFADFGGGFEGDYFPCSLFENPGNANHWLTLRLQGVHANRFGVGARIEVHVKTPKGERSIHVVGGTGGSFGSSSLQQEIGLGDATAIAWVEIKWPGGAAPQRLEGLPLDRFVRIVEGAANFEVLTVKSFKLGGKR